MVFHFLLFIIIFIFVFLFQFSLYSYKILGDESALSMWKRFKDLSIHEYKNTYKRLNVSFDVFSGESQQSEGMFRAMDELKNNNLLTEDKGALLIDLEVTIFYFINYILFYII